MLNRKLMLIGVAALLTSPSTQSSLQTPGRHLKEDNMITQCDLKNREYLKTKSGRCRMRCSKNHQSLKTLKGSKKKRCRNISKKMCRLRRRKHIKRGCSSKCLKEGYIFVKANKACVKESIVAQCIEQGRALTASKQKCSQCLNRDFVQSSSGKCEPRIVKKVI